MHTLEDGATAPITAPDFAVYTGSRHHVPRNTGRTAGYTLHFWEIRGELFLTVGANEQVHKPCDRCGGSGQFSYNSMDGSMCYGCYGDGLGAQVKDWDDANRLVKNREARVRAAQRKAFREDWDLAIAWNAWRDGRAGLIATLLALPTDDQGDYARGFLGDMARRVASYLTLSEKQEAAVLRSLGDRAARIEAKQAAGHWGVVGKRDEVTVTIKSVKDFDGDYGIRYLVVMETAEGQTLKTWASGDFGWMSNNRVERARAEGADGAPVVVTIKATVKEHGEYNGTPQTEVQRVKVVQWAGE